MRHTCNDWAAPPPVPASPGWSTRLTALLPGLLLLSAWLLVL